MVKVVPRPTSDSNSIEPLCSCTNRKELASPIPVPPGRVVKNNWKILLRFSGADSFSRVCNDDLSFVVILRELHGELSAGSHRVAAI